MPPPSWQISPTGSPNTLIVVDVVNPMVIWAAGGGFAGARNDGTVVRTVNGGDTWDIVTPPDATDHVLRDIEAFDEDNALLLASTTRVLGGRASFPRISRTTNGGATWETVFEAHPPAFYDSMAFFDDRRGLAVGDPIALGQGGRFPILGTVDGGRTWALVKTSGTETEKFEGARATGTSLVAVGSQDAWFGTTLPVTNARVFHSRDGGRTWTVATTPIPGEPAGIVSLSFLGDRINGLAVGGDPPPPTGQTDVGEVARTSDGGATWVGVGPLNGFRNSVAWIPDLADTAVAVGHRGSDVSDDGGDTWTQFDGRLLLGVDARSSDACWAVGQGGVAAKLII